MTVTASEPTMAAIIDSANAMGFTLGAWSMKARVVKLLMSMGERDLASTVGRMDVPTRDNVTESARPTGQLALK